MVKVLVVAQTPPPYGGSPIMVEHLLRSKFADVRLIHVRMGFVSHIKDHGKINLRKILHVFTLIARIIYHRIVDKPQIFYYLPAGPNRVTLLRDFPILISTRWLFEKTIFHYQLAGICELYDRLPRWQQWLFRRAYFGADAAVRLSELNPEDGKRLDATREYVVPNAIDDPCPERAIARMNHTPSANDPMRILFVGMLRESKGVLVLLEACAKLAARGIQFQLEIMGQWKSDEFAASVQRRVQELGLTEYVRYLGVLVGKEKFAAYCRADVFCFPTFFNSEGLPVVLVEAMACRLPVVSTRWRGIPSVVDEGESGFLVEPHDPEAMARQLARLAYDPELRASMGRAGRDKFERKYTLDRHAASMRRVLRETAGFAVEDPPEVVSDVRVKEPVSVTSVTSESEARKEASPMRARPKDLTRV
jgi:glycosyltransferase involved in cell wall biosynthesis